jgi:hypothetical protein
VNLDTPTLLAGLVLLAAVAYALWPRKKARTPAQPSTAPILPSVFSQSYSEPTVPLGIVSQANRDGELLADRIVADRIAQQKAREFAASISRALAAESIASAPAPAEPFVLDSAPAVASAKKAATRKASK